MSQMLLTKGRESDVSGGCMIGAAESLINHSSIKLAWRVIRTKQICTVFVYADFNLMSTL